MTTEDDADLDGFHEDAFENDPAICGIAHESTDAIPGSDEKISILHHRYHLGLAMHLPGDCGYRGEDSFFDDLFSAVEEPPNAVSD